MSVQLPDTRSSSQLPLVDFLNTLPSPLTTALVGLAPYISRVRYGVQILSWKTSWEESWIAIAVWWAVCMLADVGARYCLPLAVMLGLVVARSSQTKQITPAVVTEDMLQQTVADLSTLHALLPVIPPTTPNILPLHVLLRVAAILYVPYLLLTNFVRLRVLLALAGTVLLTWRARWPSLLRRALWRSAYVRWTIYRIWSFLSGQSLPPRIPSASAAAAPAHLETAPEPANSVLFLFTVYENQRWWMGLDWTAALLPGERPAWCTAALQPAPPPAAFALPAPTTVYVRSGSGKDAGARVKRTARWAWGEPEWRVVVHRDGEASARVERPLPQEEAPAVGTASRMLRAAGKMREGSVSLSNGIPERARDEGDVKAPEEEGREGELITDADGWVYADNKWEGASAKGGMGKYTRYRRWTRIAVLSETVEPAGPGDVGIQKDEEVTAPLTATSPVNATVLPDWEPAHGRHDSLDKKIIGQGSHGEDDGLRKRLKAAVQGTAHS
ncbi:hypothetical protein WOLCODRAFT_138378 [Wolfiporia cocos MD-104 SS10]|uniref:TECPR1-like DysF domain-containing protein n=1 Tax=Wolfiporia cocos (strain MD-104) TaxID=742152 RepID=A0A2H3JMU0_WOLCO|nr:hypothetical protein WOLCODRAFT_138378 [Wolfiporia cocos MD-104 SS10]